MKVVTHCVICGGQNLVINPAAMHPFVTSRIYHWTPVMIKAYPNTDEAVLSFAICNTIRCQACGFVFCDVRFDDEEMGRLYANYRDEGYITLREQWEPGYRQLNDELEYQTVPYFAEIEAFILDVMLARPRRVMDWGGGNGINTPFKDAEIDIFDISAKTLKFGRMVAEPNPPYDLVVCSNVLEHVSYPRWTLRQIKACMDKDTVLYIEVPLENLDYSFWHEHVNRFTEGAMAKLADVCGLETIGTNLLPPPKHGYEHLLQVACRLKA